MKAEPQTSRPGNEGKANPDGRHPSKTILPLGSKELVNIIEHMRDGVVVLDKDWHYVYVNQKAAELLQREKPSDLIGKHIWTEYPEGVGQPFQLAYEKAMRDQTAIIFEDHYEPWDLWFENRIYPLPEMLLILFTDITDRKRTERLLAERQHMLQKILDTEPGTVYIYDLEERRNIYVNRHWLSEFGYTAEETQALGDQLLIRIMHPDDLAHISAHHEKWRQAGAGDIQEIEYRVYSKTGEWRWLHSHEAPFMHDELGKVTQILGISYEVTPRRAAQEALRRSEQQLGLIFDTVSDIIFLLSVEADGRYRFVSVNKAFLQTTGLRSDQVIGRYADEIIPPASQSLVFGNYRKAIHEGVPVSWEEVSEYPAGIKTAIVTVNASYNEAGVCTHLVGAVHDITERKQMEGAVLRERDLSDAMLNSLPGAFYFYDQTGNFLRWNQNFEIVSGYSSEEIAKMNPLDFFVGAEKEYIAERIQQVFEKGESDAEANFVTKNGKLIPYYFTGSRLDIEGSPYLIGMGIDITQRRQAEEEKIQLLHNLKERVKELTALHATMELLQYDRGITAELLQAIADLIPLAWQYPEITAARLVFAGNETQTANFTPTPWMQSARFSASSKDGLIEIAYLREAPPEAEGPFLAEERRLIDSLADMLRLHFERKHAEDELRKLNLELEQRVALRTEELAAAMQKAQESDRLKSAFLATMSHELRTPLNSIIGFTGVLLQGLAGPLNEEQAKQLNMTRNSARHLLALINDILDISKIEAGQLEIVKRPFDMREAIESSLRVVQPLLQKKNLQLSTSIGGSVGVINQDRRRVEQVLINLVNNAIKFTEHGAVEIQCQFKEGRLETRVRDTGIGIRPEDLEGLFKPFRQIDSGLARSHEGTGLGLAICKHLVTAMGGEITVESQWGAGSTFRFILPT
jgi:PAS domain S-box-containing protein